MTVRLYEGATLKELEWPATADGDYAKRYLLPLLQDGVQAYIGNVDAPLAVLRADEVVLPVTIGRFRRDNSYVCSPYTHYFAYSLQELDKLGNKPLEALCKAIVHPLGWWYRWMRFDDAVLVNNWLLSTNLYPQLNREQIGKISACLLERFVDRPVVFRSVDARGNPVLFETLRSLGYRMVFSRQVYYQDVHAPGFWRRKQLKVDLTCCRKSPYRCVDGPQLLLRDCPRICDRIAQLYRMLYLEKYSRFNPQLTPAFFQLALERGLLNVQALVCDGRMDAVWGYFSRNGIMTQPLFGYDTGLPQELNLYRLLSMQVLLEGQRQGLLINCSAGVGEFKRLRGGVAALEYNAVFDRHLPRVRRLPWALLQRVLDRVAVPLMVKRGF